MLKKILDGSKVLGFFSGPQPANKKSDDAQNDQKKQTPIEEKIKKRRAKARRQYKERWGRGRRPHQSNNKNKKKIENPPPLTENTPLLGNVTIQDGLPIDTQPVNLFPEDTDTGNTQQTYDQYAGFGETTRAYYASHRPSQDRELQDISDTSFNSINGYSPSMLAEEQKNTILLIMEEIGKFLKDPYNYTSLMTALVPAIYAYSYPSGQDPRYISEAWGKMTDFQKGESFFFGASSLSVNFWLNKYFYPKAKDKLKELWGDAKRMRDDPKQFIRAVALFIGAWSGAIPSASMAYDSARGLPEGEYTAIVPALFNFMAFFAMRYVSANKAVEFLMNAFNKDLDAQKDFADGLEHINYKKYSKLIQKTLGDVIQDWIPVAVERQLELKKEQPLIFDEEAMRADIKAKLIKRPLSSMDYQFITSTFAEKLTALVADHPDLINKTSNWDKFMKWSGLGFDFTFAFAIIGISIYMTSMQKAFDGINTFAKFCGGNFDAWPVLEKAFSSFVPAIVSTMAFCLPALITRDTVVRVAKSLYPKDIPIALVALAFIYGSSYGPGGVAASILRHPNLFGLHLYGGAEEGPHALYHLFAELYLIGNFIAGADVNGINVLLQKFLSKPITAITVSIDSLVNELKTNPKLFTEEAQTDFINFLKAVAEKHSLGNSPPAQDVPVTNGNATGPSQPGVFTWAASGVTGFFQKVKDKATCCAKEPNEGEDYINKDGPSSFSYYVNNV